MLTPKQIQEAEAAAEQIVVAVEVGAQVLEQAVDVHDAQAVAEEQQIEQARHEGNY